MLATPSFAPLIPLDLRSLPPNSKRQHSLVGWDRLRSRVLRLPVQWHAGSRSGLKWLAVFLRFTEEGSLYAFLFHLKIQGNGEEHEKVMTERRS